MPLSLPRSTGTAPLLGAYAPMSTTQSLDTLREGAGSAPGQTELLRRVWRDHVRMHVPVLLIAVAFMAIEGAALGAFAWLVRPLFDGLFEDGSFDGVILIGGLIAGLFILRAVASFTQRLIVVSVGLKVTTRLQGLLLRHMLTLDQRFFQDNSPGSLLERVRGDATALQSLATTALMSLGRDSITLISLLVVMLATDWQWTLTALIGIPLLVGPLYLLHRLIRATSLQSRAAAARLSTRLDEIFHGMQTIKLNGLEKSEDARFESELKGYLRPSLRAQAGQAANPATMDLLAAAGFIAVLWFGGQQIVSGEKTIGQFMSFFTALGLMFEPLRRLSNVAGQVQASLASVERIYAAFDTKPTVVETAEPKPMPSGDIRFDDVVFGYEDAPVLRGFVLRGRSGPYDRAGRSLGCGKDHRPGASEPSGRRGFRRHLDRWDLGRDIEIDCAARRDRGGEPGEGAPLSTRPSPPTSAWAASTPPTRRCGTPRANASVLEFAGPDAAGARHARRSSRFGPFGWATATGHESAAAPC